MKNKPDSAAASLPDLAAHGQTLAATLGDAWTTISGLSLPMPAVTELQNAYLKQSTELWNQTLRADRLPPADRRFAAQDWAANPASAYVAQMYLLNARTLLQMAESLQGDEKTKQRIRFAVQQWVDAAAPSNYLALNPEAQRKAIETRGASIAQGLKHLLADVQQGHVSQTDESMFEVGRNVATTEGSVVFENELFQLIEYKPLTAKVFERPMLFVPPCINKYYILDLQPDNSLIRYTVAQGHRLFVVSWRNADDSIKTHTWDQYIEDAAIRAIEVVQDITGSERVNTLGFCVGGTILATALSVLAARGEKPAASVTLLTTLLDFSNTGVLDLFIDETMVQMREMTLGPQSPGGGSLLKGQELATTFSFLRPNDLVWNYVVGNYLKGETPPPFDLLYWNSDSTNLPGPMYCWYLRNTYLENNLVVPGKVTVCGAPVDLRTIDAPVYVYASREDHIVPWDAAYRNTQVLGGASAARAKSMRFVLGASGHIAGVINPPAKGKRSHWIGATASLPAQAQQWLDTAKEHPGSWWPDWATWLAGHAGRQVAAPKSLGNRRHRPIEAAPGRYVKQKAS
ncbi:MAG: class I poly(R)-hydroxyalkanoic acid synthase [Burkholderiales bacterium]|nr:class I poly(R)-hydroxyalkanoic acid synthase [Burkholderiales bacterium]